VQQRLGVFANQFVRSHRRRGALSEVAIVDGVPNSNLLSLVGWLPGCGEEATGRRFLGQKLHDRAGEQEAKERHGNNRAGWWRRKGTIASRITIRIKAQ
jgi:hypothetical protein